MCKISDFTGYRTLACPSAALHKDWHAGGQAEQGESTADERVSKGVNGKLNGATCR